MTTTTESIAAAWQSHLVAAIVDPLNPFTSAPRKPIVLLEYRATRRQAGSLTGSSIGTTIACKTGGGRGVITSVSKVVQDGTIFVQINATGGASRFCRPGIEIVTWSMAPVVRPAPVRSTLVEDADRLARSEMIAAHQEHLAAENVSNKTAAAPRPLAGILAGLVG